MSASLVGSEMCIRDSTQAAAMTAAAAPQLCSTPRCQPPTCSLAVRRRPTVRRRLRVGVPGSPGRAYRS
eukprot:12978608-Alexandrium_andersonii.AAC.1